RADARCASFFFQAADGIRDFHVTGVQTCALPILFPVAAEPQPHWFDLADGHLPRPDGHQVALDAAAAEDAGVGVGDALTVKTPRSEERRVGRECRERRRRTWDTRTQVRP